MTLGDNYSFEWDSAISTAITDWNNSSVLSLTAVAGNTSPRRCKAATGTIEICSKAYGNNGWLGIAGISVSGDHIVSGYTKLNDTYYCSGCSYDTPAWRALVACQEIGHDFGLGHVDENFNNSNEGTCMDYTGNPGGPPSNEHPNQHDYDQLEDTYTHLDGGSGDASVDDGDGGTGPCAKNPNHPLCGAGVSSVINDIDFPDHGSDPDPQWGNLVQRSLDGHQEVYVLDLGNGNKEITHVTWVESRNNPHHRHDEPE